MFFLIKMATNELICHYIEVIKTLISQCYWQSKIEKYGNLLTDVNRTLVVQVKLKEEAKICFYLFLHFFFFLNFSNKRNITKCLENCIVFMRSWRFGRLIFFEGVGVLFLREWRFFCRGGEGW